MPKLKLGVFFQPLHFPERDYADCWDDDISIISHADSIGFDEVWVGEHYCIRWENLPAPELLIAKALGVTKQIIFGTGVNVLSYQHPAIIAHKIAALDHLARGRLIFGIGAGGTPSDFEMFDIDFSSSESRERMKESIEMIIDLWSSKGELKKEGKFWDLKIPFANTKMTWEYHLRPYQKPHPPIAVGGTSPFSKTLEWGASKGFLPISIDANIETIKSHWATIEKTAKSNNIDFSRLDWRVSRVIYVAETDEIAKEHILESSMNRGFSEYFMRVYRIFGGLSSIKHDKSVNDNEVNVQYALENLWIVGSVDTVIDKLQNFYTEVGGFGTLLIMHFDTYPYPERYKKSMSLLINEVIPKISNINFNQ